MPWPGMTRRFPAAFLRFNVGRTNSHLARPDLNRDATKFKGQREM